MSTLVEDAIAEIQRQAREIEALKDLLLAANSQTEHFERHWYLRGDEIDALEATIADCRQELAAWDRSHAKNGAYEELKDASRQALAVLKGCLEHPDADDAIAALNYVLKETK